MISVSSCVQISFDFPPCEHSKTNACDWSPGLFALVSISRFHDGRKGEEKKANSHLL